MDLHSDAVIVENVDKLRDVIHVHSFRVVQGLATGGRTPTKQGCLLVDEGNPVSVPLVKKLQIVVERNERGSRLEMKLENNNEYKNSRGDKDT